MDQEKKEEKSEEINQFEQPSNDNNEMNETFETSETFETPTEAELTPEVPSEESDGFTEAAKPTEIQELAEKAETEPIEVPELIEDVKPYEAPKQDTSSEPTTGVVEEQKSEDKVEKHDDDAPVQEEKSVKVAKKGHAVQLVIVIFVVWSIITAGGAYLLRDKAANDSEAQTKDQITSLQNQLKAANKNEADLQSQIDELNGTSSSTTTTNGVAPSSSAASSIKASITSGNTAALEGYMASSVSVATATSNSTSISTGTATAAVTSVTNFIANATLPWDFALTPSVLAPYQSSTSHGKYFPTIAIVGKSANSKVISFSFDSAGKINTVFLANSDSSL